MIAYYNHGRWVADCDCGSGILVEAGSGAYVCRDCSQPHQITVPTEAAAVELICGHRPPKNRNWSFGEPLHHLLEENTEHGVA